MGHSGYGVCSTWQLYVYYSLVLGTAQALFSVNIPTTVAAWFRRRLGLAVGLQQSLGGMGASVMAPALAFLLASTDLADSLLDHTRRGGRNHLCAVDPVPERPR